MILNIKQPSELTFYLFFLIYLIHQHKDFLTQDNILSFYFTMRQADISMYENTLRWTIRFSMFSIVAADTVTAGSYLPLSSAGVPHFYDINYSILLYPGICNSKIGNIGPHIYMDHMNMIKKITSLIILTEILIPMIIICLF